MLIKSEEPDRGDLIDTVLYCTIYVEYSRTEKMKKSLANTGALIWKGLPKSLKSLRKSQFKSKIKQTVLGILKKTDDYTDVPQILSDIKQMKKF